MRSEIKEYDMYKAGEYIRGIDNHTMTYYKLIDKIPDDNLKLDILRIRDKIRDKSLIFLLLCLGLYLALGILLGFAIGQLYYDIINVFPSLT